METDNKTRKATPEVIGLSFRMAGIQTDPKNIPKIIDIFYLIEEKGGEADLHDMCRLIASWGFEKTQI